MGGGCDGEGVREIDIENGDLGSRARVSAGGVGCRGRLWRPRVDVGPNLKRYFAVHTREMGRARHRMQVELDLLKRDPDGQGKVRPARAGRGKPRKGSRGILISVQWESGHLGWDSAGQTLGHYNPWSWWFAVRFPEPAVPRGLVAACQEKARGASRNIVRDKRLVDRSNGTGRHFPPTPFIGLRALAPDPILPRWARTAASRLWGISWKLSEIPMAVDPVTVENSSVNF